MSKKCDRCKEEIYNNAYLKISELTEKTFQILMKKYPGGIDWIQHYCWCKLDLIVNSITKRG